MSKNKYLSNDMKNIGNMFYSFTLFQNCSFPQTTNLASFDQAHMSCRDWGGDSQHKHPHTHRTQ